MLRKKEYTYKLKDTECTIVIRAYSKRQAGRLLRDVVLISDYWELVEY